MFNKICDFYDCYNNSISLEKEVNRAFNDINSVLKNFYKESLTISYILDDDLFNNFKYCVECELKERLSSYKIEELWVFSIYTLEVSAYFLFKKYKADRIKYGMLNLQSLLIEENFKGKEEIDIYEIVYICEVLAYLNNFNDNRERVKFIFNDEKEIKHYSYEELLESPLVDSSLYDNYFEKYNQQCCYPKPEEMNITDLGLSDFLDKQKITPVHIENRLNYLFIKKFGFSLDDFRNLKDSIQKLELKDNDKFCIHINQNDLYQIIDDIDREKLESIISYFSYNNLKKANESNLKCLCELKCFYKSDNYIYFGPINVLQVFEIFNNTFVSGEYSSFWGFDKEFEKKKIKSYHEKVSKFLSYKIASIFNENGYLVPKENNIPLVDITKVKNIIINDIDVLAIDTSAKIIYNIELKHVKSPLTLRESYLGQIKNSYYKKIIEREEILRENVDIIIEELFKTLKFNLTGFKIKSIIVTSRPDYKGYLNDKRKEINKGVKYYTWNDFIDKIVEHNL